MAPISTPPPHPFPLSPITGLLLPLLLWTCFTPWSAEIDLKASQAFYQDGSFSLYPLWGWLYVYGLWPAWIVTASALIALFLSFKKSYRSLRLASIYLLLTFSIGSGLIIHAALKEHWGRPRPKQVIEFGGKQPFRPYYEPNTGKQPEPSKSFTSGHASLGYFFFSFAFLGALYRSRLLFWLGLGAGLSLGALLSLTRVAQGGHFLSDTLASALIMWLTAWFFAYWLFITPRPKSSDR